MCFHNSMNKRVRDLASRYGRRTDLLEITRDIINEQYRISAYSHPLCAIVTADEEIQAFHWGLIPFWTKDLKSAKEILKGTINARSETLFEKPSYRSLIRRKRCLIPSTGYFEHHHNEDKTTTPYFIYLKEQEIFSMGGLYDEWLNPETGEVVKTFTQITTPANKLTGAIHNGGKNPYRMPLIFSKEEEEKWLDPGLSKEAIIAMMHPFPERKMSAYTINNDFLKKPSTDQSIIRSAG